MNIDSILEKSKEFEYIVTTYDPVYNDLIIAIEIVKNFIISNNLIIYGGSAIDYALRLKGDKIYPDDALKVPDLDFYSPANVEHSYTLADMLYAKGYTEARAINAQHMETMRVDIMDNHFIADITYRPRHIFDKLPYLEYNGMRVIHPMFQRIDIHSSLSFPYDNVPREVLFERWSKDVKRFNLLNKYYPVEDVGEAMVARPCKVPADLRRYVLCGFAAYAVLYSEFARLVDTAVTSVQPAAFDIGEYIQFDTIDQRFEIVHFSPRKAADELGLTDTHNFEPYINMIPATYTGIMPNKVNVTIYSTRSRLLSTNSVRVGNVTLRIANIQYLMKQFLSLYFMHRSTPKKANAYLVRYKSMLAMIAAVEKITNDMNSPFFPTIQTYGNENINLARAVALNRLYADLDGAPMYSIPPNYYPARAAERRSGHPIFNPEDVPYFREEGREMAADQSET